MNFIQLNNGYKMPSVGLGLWQVDNIAEFESTVNTALEIGYRHFDIAYNYKNEAYLGKVLKEWLDSGKIKREELFITTKLPMIGMTPGRVAHFVNLSLTALQLDYIDLYIPHFPIGFQYINDAEITPKSPDGQILFDMTTDLVAVWRAMEDQVAAGRLKSIGLSNFNEKQIEKILEVARIKPANLQVELNAYFQQPNLLELCRNNNISVVGYANLGSSGRKEYFKKIGRASEFQCESILDEPIVSAMVTKYHKTNAQILLRFLVQLGVVPIPKSSNPKRLRENFEIFDFEIDSSDMEALKGLDRGSAGRSFSMSFFPGVEAHPEFPF